MTQPPDLVAIPRYMKRFHCIGPDCERTCCANWNVPVDEATYKAFRRVPDKAVRSWLVEGLTKKRELKIRDNGDCHFLAEDHLCAIHRDLGEAMLPQVCGTFPRGLGHGEESKELHATMSCPEVARQALFDPEALHIEAHEPASKHMPKHSFAKTVWQLQPTHAVVAQATLQLAEGLIRDRAQPMWHGLMDVVTLYYTWHRQGAHTVELAIPMLQSLATVAAEGQWRNKWSDSRIQVDMQIQHVRAFARGADKIKVKLDDDTDMNVLVPRYKAAFRDVVEPYLRANPHVMEALVCTEMRHLSAHTLLGHGWRQVAQVALLYGYVKAALTLRASVTGTISDADVVDVVVDAWRHIRHAAWFRKAISGGSETSVPEYVLNIVADPTHEPVTEAAE